MATHCDPPGPTILEHAYRLCVTDDGGPEINVSIEPTDKIGLAPYTYYWTMYLQRCTESRCETIGTRTGYVSPDSPSHRTFTNVAPGPDNMRIWVDYYETSAKNEVYVNTRLPYFRP